ncbi:LacI family DNA-binding transcriptional regulator [Chitinophaga solisilvae]|uniref:LacI family DNA-binding transcriptional regulator n=1 Tax=Chitinophaga solisilvae TaxID=1233460 RepID=UPI00136C38C0|nr:LacI family DNA-binding transcriptional regulator [Chitinophaga solisilvae]
MKKVNIKALAQELNLSSSTVSKALRDSYEISAATKQRVLEMAARLQYTPNAYASSLRGKKSKNIAVIIPEVADSFFSLAINGIEAAVKAKGYHVLIYLTHESFAAESAIMKEFYSGRVDGVLMSVSRETTDGQHIRQLMAQDIPVVFFDRALEELPVAKVLTDDYHSGYTAARHLIQNGCRRIAFLGMSETLSISHHRRAGYQHALQEYGLAATRKNMISCTADPAVNYKLVKKLLQQATPPDGIVASMEKLTTTVYQVCQALQLRMPADVKLVCFSNLEIATILQPSLTTITQPAFEMGKTAAELLLRQLEKKPVRQAEAVVIPSELVIRDSTKKS